MFTINFAHQYHQEQGSTPDLILTGMGEPGSFAQDSLRLVMSNIVVAVKSMGEDQFATTLLGTRRKEMSIADALRGFLPQGVLDGYERLDAIAEAVKEDREALRSAATRPLSVLLVHADERAGKAIEDELNAITHDSSIKHLTLTITAARLAEVKADDSAWDDTMSKAPPDTP